DRQRLDAKGGEADHDQRWHEDVDEAEAAESWVRLRRAEHRREDQEDQRRQADHEKPVDRLAEDESCLDRDQGTQLVHDSSLVARARRLVRAMKASSRLACSTRRSLATTSCRARTDVTAWMRLPVP